MAHDLQLLQVAGDDLRHGADPVPLYRRGHRQQVPDPAHAAGELAPSQQALDAVTSGSVECAHTPSLLLFRQGLRRSASAPAFRSGSTAASSCRGGTFAGGERDRQRLAQEAQRPWHPGRHSGTQMGAWFKKEINSSTISRACRFRIGGMGGPVLARVGAVPQHIAHADIYAGAGARHHRCRRIHLSLRRREARPAARWRSSTTSPCWWESGGMMHMVHQPGEVERAAQGLSVALVAGPATPPTPGCSPSTTRSTRRRSNGSSPAAPCSSPSRNRSWRPATRRPRSTSAELCGQGRPFQAGVRLHAMPSARSSCPGGRSPSTPTTASCSSTRGRG